MRTWLIKIRKDKGWSTYQAAAAIGISQSFYWAIENGTRGVPVETAKKIAKTYGFRWTRFFE